MPRGGVLSLPYPSLGAQEAPSLHTHIPQAVCTTCTELDWLLGCREGPRRKKPVRQEAFTLKLYPSQSFDCL